MVYTIFNWATIKFKDYIGSGANGEVWKCEIKQEKYAIKKVFQDWVRTSDDKKQYYKDIFDELDICSKMIGKKRLMNVFGYAENEGDFYIISELLDNKGCLHSYLVDNDLGYHDRLKIFSSILKAVKELHDIGIVHSDLKTENMVYYYDYKFNTKYVKLIDFNTTYYMNDIDEIDIPLIHGTYGYCAMEQHKKKLNKKSDIYSLGVILLELILNYDLWDISVYNYQKYRKSILENLEAVKNEKLKKIIKKCIRVKPCLRYNIDELKKEFSIELKNNVH